jgi:hyaluronan synthase
MPFYARHVLAVTGSVHVMNEGHSLLTRLLDIRYSTAFEFERSAYSQLDSVVCACGAFSAWRSWVVKEHLQDYIDQTFLGRKVQYGDDRRLTNYCLLHGKVMYQPYAVAYTLVPEKLSHFLRQQLRWNKSYIRETLFAIRYLKKTRIAWWLLTLDAVMWVALTAVVVWTLVVYPIIFGAIIPIYYLGFLIIMAYMRAAHHKLDNESNYLLVPLYAILHLTLLIPLKVIAVLTLRQGGWGTRSKGVEVKLDE